MKVAGLTNLEISTFLVAVIDGRMSSMTPPPLDALLSLTLTPSESCNCAKGRASERSHHRRDQRPTMPTDRTFSRDGWVTARHKEGGGGHRITTPETLLWHAGRTKRGGPQ